MEFGEGLPAKLSFYPCGGKDRRSLCPSYEAVYGAHGDVRVVYHESTVIHSFFICELFILFPCPFDHTTALFSLSSHTLDLSLCLARFCNLSIVPLLFSKGPISLLNCFLLIHIPASRLRGHYFGYENEYLSPFQSMSFVVIHSHSKKLPYQKYEIVVGHELQQHTNRLPLNNSIRCAGRHPKIR